MDAGFSGAAASLRRRKPDCSYSLWGAAYGAALVLVRFIQKRAKNIIAG